MNSQSYLRSGVGRTHTNTRSRHAHTADTACIGSTGQSFFSRQTSYSKAKNIQCGFMGACARRNNTIFFCQRPKLWLFYTKRKSLALLLYIFFFVLGQVWRSTPVRIRNFYFLFILKRINMQSYFHIIVSMCIGSIEFN